jgi:AcrR family transcriptional regulator
MTIVASKQQVRSQATRRKLLAAAEKIFAQDGFEAARLEDIAAAAGYTRGAFYANFESKEDIFFDLLQEWIAERVAAVRTILGRRQKPGDKLKALRDHYVGIAKDKQLALLSLEFKLFAIRHPAAHAKLRERYRRLRACGGEILQEVARELGRHLPISSRAVASGLGALSNGLLIEELIDAEALSDSDIRHLLALFFDGIFKDRSKR